MKRELVDVDKLPKKRYRVKLVEKAKIAPLRPRMKEELSSAAMSKWGGRLRAPGRQPMMPEDLGRGPGTGSPKVVRPRRGEYNPQIHPFQVYRMRLAGLSVQRIADIFLVTEVAIYNWRKENPEFEEAWQEGGEHADAQVAHALFQRAIGYEHESEKIVIDTKTGMVSRAGFVEKFAPDTTAGQYWLNNRQPQRWKNRVDGTLSGPDGMPLAAPNIMINPVISITQLAPVIDMTAQEQLEGPNADEEVDDAAWVEG